MSRVPSLLELSTETIASHIELFSELQAVPEEIVLDVFEVCAACAVGPVGPASP
jgi:hypothetical protein